MDEKINQYIKENFDMNKLSKFPGSGRDVGAVMRLTIGLCHQVYYNSLTILLFTPQYNNGYQGTISDCLFIFLSLN